VPLNPLQDRVRAEADQEGRKGRADADPPRCRSCPIDREKRQSAACRQEQTDIVLNAGYC
jgi:hypothetical protein